MIDLAIEIEPGPRVTVRVEGATIPTSRQEELIPVRREGSIDEDLLEDSKRRIESYLHGRGHWKADVSYARRPTAAGLDLVFTIREGAVFRIADVKVTGEKAMPRTDIDSVLGLITGAPFVESEVDAQDGRARRALPASGLPRDQDRADARGARYAAARASPIANRPNRDDKQTAWVDVSLAISRRRRRRASDRSPSAATPPWTKRRCARR